MLYSEICEKTHPELTDSEQKIWEVIEDMTGRSGFNDFWYNIDTNTQDEIFKTWVDIIDK